MDRMYPHTHKSLSEQMIERGGILAEFPSDTLPDKTNFPMRNRIVAGLSDVTVVVESNTSGGSLITAHIASGYNREVASFPGRVNDSRSAGCNELIRTNIAALITNADDLVEMMNWKDGKPKAVFTVERAGALKDIVVHPRLSGEDKNRRVGISPGYDLIAYKVAPGSAGDKAGAASFVNATRNFPMLKPG